MLVGSTPADNKNINGVLLLESSKALFTSITGGSINFEPSSGLSEIKFAIANDNLSNLKHLTNSSFFSMLLLSFHLPIKKISYYSSV